ncbi:hypothetical protein Fot_43455 [Forsythia ovata]|uniref:Uncharacterized protein n=1 Tax=Forsythia ovata TaxID=205694 RepID=A0ABD1R1L4_9LAMI
MAAAAAFALRRNIAKMAPVIQDIAIPEPVLPSIIEILFFFFFLGFTPGNSKLPPDAVSVFVRGGSKDIPVPPDRVSVFVCGDSKVPADGVPGFDPGNPKVPLPPDGVAGFDPGNPNVPPDGVSGFVLVGGDSDFDVVHLLDVYKSVLPAKLP